MVINVSLAADCVSPWGPIGAIYSSPQAACDSRPGGYKLTPMGPAVSGSSSFSCVSDELGGTLGTVSCSELIDSNDDCEQNGGVFNYAEQSCDFDPQPTIIPSDPPTPTPEPSGPPDGGGGGGGGGDPDPTTPPDPDPTSAPTPLPTPLPTIPPTRPPHQNITREDALDHNGPTYVIDRDGNIWQLDDALCPEGSAECLTRWRDTGFDDTPENPFDPGSLPPGTFIDGDGYGDDDITEIGDNHEYDYERIPFHEYDENDDGDIPTTDDRAPFYFDPRESYIELPDRRIVITDQRSIDEDGNVEDKTTTREELDDGTTITTTDTNVYDPDRKTTTREIIEITTNAAGQSTVTRREGYDLGYDDGDATGSASSECNKRPSCSDNSPTCALLIQQWEMMCLGTFAVPSTVPFSRSQTYVQNAREEYEQALSDIRSEMAESFDLSINSSGGGIASNNVDVFGTNVDFSLARFVSQLALLGSIIVAVAYVYAARVILGG